MLFFPESVFVAVSRPTRETSRRQRRSVRLEGRIAAGMQAFVCRITFYTPGGMGSVASQIDRPAMTPRPNAQGVCIWAKR